MTFALGRNRRPVDSRRNGLARLLAVIVALCHGGMSYANFVSISHEPLVWPKHEGISIIPDLHEHDHELEDEERALHHHGHNASDHSHDKPNLPSGGLHAGVTLGSAWDAPARASVYPPPCFDFERPPKEL